MEQLLDPILKLVGFVAAHVVEPRPVMGERGIGHRRFDAPAVNAVEFEREEQKMRGSSRHALLHVAEEFCPRRIDGIPGMDKPGIGADPPHQVVDRLEAPHRFGERRAGHRCELALIGLLEGDAVGIGPVEIALDRRIVEAGIKVVEIPLGQFAEGGFGATRTRFAGAPGGRLLCNSWHALT